jgi:hypothetical protein
MLQLASRHGVLWMADGQGINRLRPRCFFSDAHLLHLRERLCQVSAWTTTSLDLGLDYHPATNSMGNKVSSRSPNHAGGGRLEKNTGSSKPKGGGAAHRSLAAVEGAGRWWVGFWVERLKKVVAHLSQSSAVPRCARRQCPTTPCGGRRGKERRGQSRAGSEIPQALGQMRNRGPLQL